MYSALAVTPCHFEHFRPSFHLLTYLLTYVLCKPWCVACLSFQTKVDERLDTRRAIVVVETILSHFSERRFLITDYYEHWKVHVVAGKEFKSQWQQFIQNARKVPAA